MDNDSKKYYIYIIRCKNETLYTGITTDYKRRFLEHSGKVSGGAKYTRAFKVEKIEALWTCDNRSDASKLEAQIKKRNRDEKIKLIDDNSLFKEYFSLVLDIKKYKRKNKI